MPTTFIYKRWNNSTKSYVDSQNRALPVRPPPLPPFVSQPPSDGSSPFLNLPTEIRLDIYTYLTPLEDDEKPYFRIIRATPGAYPQVGSTRYVYFYRSPGRIFRPHHVSTDLFTLTKVCGLMRNEVLDACFSQRDETFVIEASLYNQSSAGLLPLPSQKLAPSAWVRKLLIMTVLEEDGTCKGITDLRPLQQMVYLDELRIIVGVKRTSRGGRPRPNQKGRADNPIAAIVDCIPKSAKVHISCDGTLRDELKASLGSGIEHFFEDEEPLSKDIMVSSFGYRQGRLSGRYLDHSQCGYLSCIENLDCVNSKCPPSARWSGRRSL